MLLKVTYFTESKKKNSHRKKCSKKKKASTEKSTHEKRAWEKVPVEGGLQLKKLLNIKIDRKEFLLCNIVILGNGRKKKFFCSVGPLEFFQLTAVEGDGQT